MGGQAPQQALGAGADVAGPDAPEPDHARARRDQLEVAIASLKAVLAVEDPYEAKRDQAIEIVA